MECQDWAPDHREGFFQPTRSDPADEQAQSHDPAQARLSMTRSCQVLAVPRSSAYACRQTVSTTDLDLMRQLDELYLKCPFYGSRRLYVDLQHQRDRVNRMLIQQLMGKMKLQAMLQKPRTSHPSNRHKIYPY